MVLLTLLALQLKNCATSFFVKFSSIYKYFFPNSVVICSYISAEYGCPSFNSNLNGNITPIKISYKVSSKNKTKSKTKSK